MSRASFQKLISPLALGLTFFSFIPSRASAGCFSLLMADQHGTARHLFSEFKELTPDESQELVLRAESLVSAFEKHFEHVLFPTSGFAMLTDLETRLSQSSGRLREAYELIKNEEFEIVISTPAAYRESVLRFGHQNMWVLQKSESLSIFSAGSRAKIETRKLNLNHKSHRELHPAIMPKYGALGASHHSPYRTTEIGYGDDLYVLKKETIQKRVTFSPGDSFSRLDYSNPKWDGYFIPYRFRALLAAGLVDSLKKGLIGYPEKKMFGGIFAEPQPMSRRISLFTRLKMGRPEVVSRYVEAQIWGPLTSNDIKAVYLSPKSRTAETVAAFKAHGITTYDRDTKEPL